MDLRQVTYAVAVIDHGGFTRAARALHVAQPSLSQAVRRLEDDLGAPLFDRIGRRVRLTEAGRAFEGPARQLLRQAENVAAAVAGHAELDVGTVDVVALPTLVADPLAEAIGRFRRRHPGVTVRVLDPGTAEELHTMVRDGTAEVGVTESGPTPHGVERRPLSDQELMAVLPPGTEAAGRRLHLRSLVDVPLVLGPPGTSTRLALETALDELGARPSIVVETDQREAIVPLVLAGAGASVLPAPLAAEARASGATVVGLTPSLRRSLSVVFRGASLSPAATAFVEILTASGGD